MVDVYDVAVIGGGIIGASAVQHLTAAGFASILLEQGDFASATSSRTSRLQHCGLTYFSPAQTFWSFFRHPTLAYENLELARRAMRDRSGFVRTTPERVKRVPFHFPVYRNGPVPIWKAKLGFKALELLDPGCVPLEMELLDPAMARRDSALCHLRNLDDLIGVVRFTEYQFDWPERVCVDAVLNAVDQGAVVQNYLRVTAIRRVADGSWEVSARDLRLGQDITVRARAVVNAAGIWVDQLAQASNLQVPTLNQGAKGTNVAVRLPPEFRGLGFEAVTQGGEPFYIIPWRDLHFFGPKDKPHDASDAGFRASEEEIVSLLEDINYFFPGLKLGRDDILYSWAGVRPRTARIGHPAGSEAVQLHDLASGGLPGYYVYTGGLYMTHRAAGRTIARTVGKRVTPSRRSSDISYAARYFPASTEPAIAAAYPDVSIGNLRFACEHEKVRTLEDLMFRRVPIGWSANMGNEIAHDVASAVQDVMGWSPAEAEGQVQAYIEGNRRWFGLS